MVIIGWNVLMAMWIVWGLVGAARSTNACSADEFTNACQTGTAIGAGVVIGVQLFVAAAVDVILGVIWFVTRPAGR
jgi:hypothetical protein